MNKVAKFYKVSEKQFNSDCGLLNVYDDIKLPMRATKGSAGYDFYLPFDIDIEPNQTAKVATGIRVSMEEGYVLFIFPRSGLGFKYQLHLANTVGIIDKDYFDADNEGHIIIKLVNGSNKPLHLSKGDAFAQGVFLQYGITIDDEADGIRHGGFGSTSKNG